MTSPTGGGGGGAGSAGGSGIVVGGPLALAAAAANQVNPLPSPHPHHHHSHHHGHHRLLKDEPPSRTGSAANLSQSYGGALDLSNDEAHLPDSSNSGGGANEVQGPKTFTGSVSREASRDSTSQHTAREDPRRIGGGKESSAGTSQSKSAAGERAKKNSGSGGNRSHRVILPLQPSLSSPQVPVAVTSSSNAAVPTPTPSSSQPSAPSTSKTTPPSSATAHHTLKSSGGGNTSTSRIDNFERLNENASVGDRFQYILAASTSLATKINDPTITYLNQGQAYELRLKKLGDLSPYRKRQLRSVVRICFHERRLQYMEAEQVIPS